MNLIPISELRAVPRRPPNRAPLFLLGGFLLFFGVFFFLVSRKSPLAEARQQVRQAQTVPAVKQVWDMFHGARPSGDTTLTAAVRQRLLVLHPSATETADIVRWLPRPLALNIVVVPDLSSRLKARLYPNQVQNDTTLLNQLSRDFLARARKSGDSPDRLVIELTNKDQLGDQSEFEAVADSLTLDLADPARPRGLTNRLYLKKLGAAGRLRRNVARVYAAATAKAQAKALKGADFTYYMSRKVADRIRPSTLAQEQRNVLVFITDGYLETSPSASDPHYTLYTGSDVELQRVGLLRKQGASWEQALATVSHSRIPPADVDLSNVDVLVLEVAERGSGQNRDFEILRHYWQEWFYAMHAHNVQFWPHEDGMGKTRSKLTNYLRQLAPPPQP